MRAAWCGGGGVGLLGIESEANPRHSFGIMQARAGPILAHVTDHKNSDGCIKPTMRTSQITRTQTLGLKLASVF